MDSLTVELPGVAAYLDDLIITGSTVDEHWANLNRLLAKLQEHDFSGIPGPCIDKEGKRPSESSIAALKQLPIPQDTQQVKAFLGKITYYGRFISNLADKAAPLYNLLKDGVSFAWTNSCQQAFTKLKKDVINATNLSHYDESQTLVLATDASSYGVGAVLSQQDADDIEKLTKACDVCKQLSAAPTQCFTEWPKTEHPWERVHLDFAGPFKDKMWLICIDAHSKFPYMGKMEIGQTSAKQTIQVLKDIFSLEGLPNTVVTDNGPQFTSSDFEAFCKQHGISHITSPPHHPPSNGEAERFVQTFKRSVEKNCVGGVPLTDSVRLTLATYRSLPHPALEWKTPAEVLHGRQPRCLLSLINPFNTRNYQTKSNNNTSSQFAVNSLVYARNYSSGPKWVPGKIIRRVGNTIFLVDTDRGIWKRHCNQLQIRLATESMPNDESIAAEPTPEHSQYPTTRRYPQRIRKAPERYEP
ncbi:hypothetical protein EB796_024978 [Bugula neritina]|uniref:Integrase catalytic domain-containing protein n=1 Tax=Bugula neritina TaxID=10212 RepID=A0A7J7IRZ2_BUGNE|nr:hypothetical protein EB796_024978 [Bugula neritina]